MASPSGLCTTFLYSSAEHVYGGWTTDVLSVLANGAAAVNLFFVISGFVLLQSLTRGPDLNWVNAARFEREFLHLPGRPCYHRHVHTEFLCHGRFHLLAGRL